MNALMASTIPLTDDDGSFDWPGCWLTLVLVGYDDRYDSCEAGFLVPRRSAQVGHTCRQSWLESRRTNCALLPLAAVTSCSYLGIVKRGCGF